MSGHYSSRLQRFWCWLRYGHDRIQIGGRTTRCVSCGSYACD